MLIFNALFDATIKYKFEVKLFSAIFTIYYKKNVLLVQENEIKRCC